MIALQLNVLYCTLQIRCSRPQVRCATNLEMLKKRGRIKRWYYRRSEVVDRIENIFLRIADGEMNA